MVEIEKDRGENSRLENGRAWQFKSHGVEGIGIFSPIAQRLLEIQLILYNPAFPGWGFPGSQNSPLSGMVRKAARLRPGFTFQPLEEVRVQVLGKAQAGFHISLPG